MRIPWLNEEKELLGRTVREFMERECPRELVRQCDEEKRFPQELVEKTGAMGWWALTLPEEYGGVGDYLDMVALLEAIAERCLALARAWNVTVNMVGGAIARFGSESQKRGLLPKVSEGKMRFAFSLSEPGSGSDAASLSCRAELRDGEFVINGQKTWCSGASLSDYMLLACRTDLKAEKHEGISLLLVPPKTPGVELVPMKVLGGSAFLTSEVYYTNARVPADNLVGELHRGWLQLLPTLHKERAALSAMAVGAAQACTRDAIEHARGRAQFGRPIGKFQAIAHKLAEMQTRVDAARLLTYQAGAMLVETGGSGAQGAARLCAEAKVFASDVYMHCAVEGVQVLGGYGYSMEHDMQRHYREAKLFQIFGGTSEIQRIIIARELGL